MSADNLLLGILGQPLCERADTHAESAVSDTHANESGPVDAQIEVYDGRQRSVVLWKSPVETAMPGPPIIGASAPSPAAGSPRSQSSRGEAAMGDERLEATLRRTHAHIEVWRRLADGAITDAQALFLIGMPPDNSPSHTVAAPALASPKALKRPRRQQSEGEKLRLERRKKLAAGALPPDLIGNLTIADMAVAEVVSRHARMKGHSCTLSMATLAEQAFVSPRTAQLAVRKLDELRLVACLIRKRQTKDNDTNQDRSDFEALARAPS
jgi:hypothetical protein